MFPKTLVLHMDFHKPLQTPKVPAQDWYYQRKLRTNLLGIYCANEKVIHCFLYDDSIGGAGPNEVISLLDFLLNKLRDKLGPHDHLIVWCDNSPAQFKHNFLFFYLDLLVKRGDFLRIDLKFLLEGHTYSICDRRFGSIQKYLDSQEIIQVPQQWATILAESGLSNVKVHWVNLEMIKDYKSFLTLQYISRNEDLQDEKFEVKRVCWLNFGSGEKLNHEGNLQLIHHPDSVFIRFIMDTKQTPISVCYVKKRQAFELNPELLEILRRENKPVKEDVKKSCVRLAQKYLSPNAVRFYESLRSIDEKSGSDCDE